MAVFITNGDNTTQNQHDVNFAAIWEHYRLAKFLYPAKLELLKPVMDRINKGWPALLIAPADIFHMHLARRGRAILSSICAFRDIQDTYVIQHAVSQGQPQHMIECLLSITSTASRDPNARFVSMYFRPESRWPVRLVRAVREVHPPALTSLTTREYLTCDPRSAAATLLVRSPVEELEVEANPELSSLTVAALGSLRATAAGIGASEHNLKRLTERYSQFGLFRERKALGATRDGALAGIALSHASGFPMNFSFLCGRVEILVHPEAPDRANVVRDLACAAMREAALCKEPVCALLVDPKDTPAAVAGGFNATGKQYSNFLWAREGEKGYKSTTIAFERWYARINQRYARTSRRSVQPSTRTTHQVTTSRPDHEADPHKVLPELNVRTLRRAKELEK
jgi:hypothetical protein